MRTALVLLAFATVVSPLDAQAPKGKKPQDRILAWELESYGGASMQEVIATARPRFLMPTPTNRDAGARTEWRVLVYIGISAGQLEGVVFGFIAGFLQDTYAPGHMGTNALAKSISRAL